MDYIEYPFHITQLGKTKITDLENHISQLIEQILFTLPGERVNRPTFGCGLRQLMFSPISQELLNIFRDDVNCSLETYLRDMITVNEVSVKLDNNSFKINIYYTINKLQLQKHTEYMGMF